MTNTIWDASQPILEIENLSISFFTRMREIPAVMDFSCKVMAGEAMGLVGESGCGKSTVALGVMRDLGKNGQIVSGSIKFKGRDLVTMAEEELRHLRGSEIAMIYQEPMASLNPAMKIGAQLIEVPMIHQGMARAEAWDLARQIVADVRLPDPDRIVNAYPHQLSGGLRQRVMIAMALMCEPRLLIADEPTTALDVTVQDQILRLLQELQGELGLGILLITHDLGIVARMAHRVSVMYAGRVVESGPAAEVFGQPTHPYTHGLLACVPVPGKVRRGDPLGSIPGTVPKIGPGFQGCAFRERCSQAMPVCATGAVPQQERLDGHRYECHLAAGWTAGIAA